MSREPKRETTAKGLTLNLIALLLLAGSSLGLRYAHLGDLGFAAALLIAIVKALLVAVFFMELLREKPTVRLAFAACLSLFALLMALVGADIVTRDAPPLGSPPGTAERRVG